MEEEVDEIVMGPSDWANLPYLVIAFIAGCLLGLTGNWWFLLGGLPYLWRYIYLQFWSYTISKNKEVLAEEKGVFSTEKVEIHYFRIKSIKVSKPFFLRIFGLSNVDIVTSEPFKPYLRIYAIKGGEEVAEALETLAEHWRDVRGVKETDFHSF